jgi:hypothetical protein
MGSIIGPDRSIMRRKTMDEQEVIPSSEANEKKSPLRKISNLKPGLKIAIVAAPVFAIIAILIFVLFPRPDETYLGKLRDSKLGGYYASDAAAIANGKAVCADLLAGGKNQGVRAEAIAVEVYCPDFASGFRTIKPIDVVGTMTISDYSPSYYYPRITNIGSWCWGSNGYNDMDEGTKVVITNQDGKRLAETALKSGKGNSYSCVFEFNFQVMEGEEEYLVAVGKRGEISYTESELKLPGRVAVVLN